MSMAAVTSSAVQTSASPEAAKGAKGKPDAQKAFAAMIAGAGDPAAARPAKSNDARAADKSKHAQRDDDSTHDDARDAADDGTTAPAPLAVAAQVPAPTTAADDKPGKARPDGASRDASATAAAAASTNGAAAGVDLTQTAVNVADPQLAPVMAALADTLTAKQASDQPVVPPATPAPATAPAAAAIVATPATATAALMASRIPTKGTPFSGSADARVPASSHKADDSDADTGSSATAGDAATPLTVAASSTTTPAAHTSLADGAAGQLASGAADRQLDLAKQGAWLDGLSHDIAAAATDTGPLRFAVAPQHLGAVQVEMTRGGDGASVTLTASSEAGRAALADARPQLIAEARSNGLHIASAQVDVGSGQTGSSDSRQSQSGQGDARPSAQSSSDTGSFSAQTNAQGQSGRQSQTRSQPLAANPVRNTASVDADPAPTEPANGLYA